MAASIVATRSTCPAGIRITDNSLHPVESLVTHKISHSIFRVCHQQLRPCASNFSRPERSRYLFQTTLSSKTRVFLLLPLPLPRIKSCDVLILGIGIAVRPLAGGSSLVRQVLFRGSTWKEKSKKRKKEMKRFTTVGLNDDSICKSIFNKRREKTRVFEI